MQSLRRVVLEAARAGADATPGALVAAAERAARTWAVCVASGSEEDAQAWAVYSPALGPLLAGRVGAPFVGLRAALAQVVEALAAWGVREAREVQRADFAPSRLGEHVVAAVQRAALVALRAHLAPLSWDTATSLHLVATHLAPEAWPLAVAGSDASGAWLRGDDEGELAAAALAVSAEQRMLVPAAAARAAAALQRRLLPRVLTEGTGVWCSARTALEQATSLDEDALSIATDCALAVLRLAAAARASGASDVGPSAGEVRAVLGASLAGLADALPALDVGVAGWVAPAETALGRVRRHRVRLATHALLHLAQRTQGASEGAFLGSAALAVLRELGPSQEAEGALLVRDVLLAPPVLAAWGAARPADGPAPAWLAQVWGPVASDCSGASVRVALELRSQLLARCLAALGGPRARRDAAAAAADALAPARAAPARTADSEDEDAGEGAARLAVGPSRWCARWCTRRYHEPAEVLREARAQWIAAFVGAFPPPAASPPASDALGSGRVALGDRRRGRGARAGRGRHGRGRAAPAAAAGGA
jgi:hypothetical protein